MACAGACYDMAETMEYASYKTGAKYCSDCTIYLFTASNFCPCCHKRLRTKPKKRKPWSSTITLGEKEVLFKTRTELGLFFVTQITGNPLNNENV